MSSKTLEYTPGEYEKMLAVAFEHLRQHGYEKKHVHEIFLHCEGKAVITGEKARVVFEITVYPNTNTVIQTQYQEQFYNDTNT